MRPFAPIPIFAAAVLHLCSGCASDIPPPADGGEEEARDAGGDGALADGDDPDGAAGDPGIAFDAGPDGADDGACDAAPLAVVEEGELSFGQTREDVALPRCSRAVYELVVPEGTTVEIGLRARGMNLLVAALAYPDDPEFLEPLDSLAAAGEGPARRLRFRSPRSGEYLLSVQSIQPESKDRYDLALACADGCDRESTRHPILLVHGWTGFSNIGPLDYFFDVPGTLRDRGFPVAVAVLDPYNSVEVRSSQLAWQIDEALAVFRARKVAIIAHSQGGLDSRRAISALGYGDRVATLVTVATPHRGTPMADVALGYVPGPAQEAMAFLLNLIGAAGGHESDAEASFHSLSRRYVTEEFNPQNPDDPRVRYLSYAGKCCILGIGCEDACDVEIAWAQPIIAGFDGDNDGMVPVESARWGDFRLVLPADHFDEVGQVAGMTNPYFDQKDFYLGLARDLAREGD
jgi:hypothetical protein